MVTSETQDNCNSIKILEQKIKNIEDVNKEKWDAHKELHKQLDRTRESDFKAAQEKLVGMNEFREQLTRERGEYLRNEVYFSEHKAIEAKFELKAEGLSNRISKTETFQSNQAGRVAAYTIAVGVAFSVLQILLHFWK